MTDVYKQKQGTIVHFQFRVQKNSIPTGHNFKKELASLIKQTVFSETLFAKQEGREITFNEPIVKNEATYSDVSVEGTLGGWVEWQSIQTF